MEKNRCMGTKPIGNVLRNTFLVMRLTVIFVCLFVLGGRASAVSYTHLATTITGLPGFPML